MPGHSRSRIGPIALLSAGAIAGVAAGAVLSIALFRADMPQAQQIAALPASTAVPVTETLDTTGARVVEPAEPAMTVAPRTLPASPQAARFDAPPRPPAMIAEPPTQTAAAAPVPTAAPVPSNRPLPPDTAPSASAPIDPFALLLLPAPVEIAETEAEAVAIEERLSSVGAAYFELPPQGDGVATDIGGASPELVAARVNDYVNLRTGPNGETDVLTVVPLDGDILAEPECTGWCQVVYQGQRGYIFDRFIEREGS